MLTNELRLKAVEAVKGIRSQCDLLLFALEVPGGPAMQVEELEAKMRKLGDQMCKAKDFVVAALGGAKRG